MQYLDLVLTTIRTTAMICGKTIKTVLTLGFALTNLSPLIASNKDYQPPQSSELYEKKSDFAPPLVSFSEGISVGGNFSAGGTITFDGTDGNPSIYHKEGLDIGYRVLFANWNFFETSLDIFTGSLKTSKSTYDYNYGAGIRFSYGYLLVDKLHGIISLATEFKNTNFEGELNKEKIKSKSSQWASGILLDYLIGFRLSTNFHFNAGIGWGWHFFSTGELINKETEEKSSHGDILQKFHTPKVHLGISYFI
jgi:hypothetical protein